MGSYSNPNTDEIVTRGNASGDVDTPRFANRVAKIDKVVTTTPTTGAYGFTLAQASAIIAQLNKVIDALEANGLSSKT